MLGEEVLLRDDEQTTVRTSNVITAVFVGCSDDACERDVVGALEVTLLM